MSYGVGTFGLRTTQRTPHNPMDKSTVISIYPKEIKEIKYTIEPGIFVIPAGSVKKPGILIIGSSSWWKDVDPEQPLLEIPVWSTTVAESIVRDYSNGLFMCNMGDCMPGLFHLPGAISLDEILAKHIDLLKQAEIKQKNWYAALVKAADTLWARTNGNPLSISDDMRLAAQELNLKEKPWMRDFTTMTLTECPACGNMVKPGYPICANCKTVVNQKLYNELGLQKAV